MGHQRKTVDPAVGRIVLVWYLAGKKFFLRVLLLHQKGVQSFDDLKTMDGKIVDTFRKACILLGLLINNFLYDSTIGKASLEMSVFQLSQMFALICVHTPPADPQALFN